MAWRPYYYVEEVTRNGSMAYEALRFHTVVRGQRVASPELDQLRGAASR